MPRSGLGSIWPVYHQILWTSNEARTVPITIGGNWENWYLDQSVMHLGWKQSGFGGAKA